MIIGLSGYARCGKDTAAAFLADHGYQRVAFADALRDLLYHLNPLLNHRDARLAAMVDAIGWEGAKRHPEVRSLLQRCGTEAGRKVLGENVWIDLAMRKAEQHENVVLTDVRFPNEADAVRAKGGRIVRVCRPGFGPVNGHGSETAMDGYLFDVVLQNDGTLDQFRRKVLARL